MYSIFKCLRPTAGQGPNSGERAEGWKKEGQGPRRKEKGRDEQEEAVGAVLAVAAVV